MQHEGNVMDSHRVENKGNDENEKQDTDGGTFEGWEQLGWWGMDFEGLGVTTQKQLLNPT